MLTAAMSGQALTFQSQTSGNYDDGGIWNQSGAIPGGSDVVIINGHSVAVTNSGAATSRLQVYGSTGGGTLTVQSGAGLTSGTANSALVGAGNKKAYVAVDSGGLLALTKNVQFAAGANSTGTLTNNGTVDVTGWVQLNAGAGSTAALTLDSGSLTISDRIIFKGTAGSTADIIINEGATLTAKYVDFQDNGGTHDWITVTGGTFRLTLQDFTNVLQFDSTNDRVNYEGGSIVFEDIDDLFGFYEFSTNYFNLWVDAGYIASATYTDQELKDFLSFNGTDAVLDSSYDGYSTWATGFGLTNSPDADMDYDYDLDGWDNLYEYGLGGDPTNGFIDGEIPAFTNIGGAFEYTYARRTDDDKLDYYLELTDNLVGGTWTNDGYSVVGTNFTGGTFAYITNQIPILENETFIKLTIERP